MSKKQCTKEWHIFNGGLPKVGAICQCGRTQATEIVGKLKPNPPSGKEE